MCHAHDTVTCRVSSALRHRIPWCRSRVEAEASVQMDRRENTRLNMISEALSAHAHRPPFSARSVSSPHLGTHTSGGFIPGWTTLLPTQRVCVLDSNSQPAEPRLVTEYAVWHTGHINEEVPRQNGSKCKDAWWPCLAEAGYCAYLGLIPIMSGAGCSARVYYREQ